jgi:hypothetical protein
MEMVLLSEVHDDVDSLVDRFIAKGFVMDSDEFHDAALFPLLSAFGKSHGSTREGKIAIVAIVAIVAIACGDSRLRNGQTDYGMDSIHFRIAEDRLTPRAVEGEVCIPNLNEGQGTVGRNALAAYVRKLYESVLHCSISFFDVVSVAYQNLLLMSSPIFI